MSKFFPVTHSIPSTKAIMSEIMPAYDVGKIEEVKLWHCSLNDTYQIQTEDTRYMLRIYRHGWRTQSDIQYELDALRHLTNKKINVASPILSREGKIFHTISAPEGKRYVVLFTYAPGKEITYRNNNHMIAYNYGQGVARIHAAMKDFRSQYDRFELDLNHLIDSPLKAIEPILSYRKTDWEYLYQLAIKLRSMVSILHLTQGFCHGDFKGWNAHITEDKIITFFDFDCCGWGWQVYDIAVFRWSAAIGRMRLKSKEIEDECWSQFIKGYTNLQPLKANDLKSIPLFVAIKQIWQLGLHTGNANNWGFSFLGDSYFDGAIKFLKGWEKDFLSDIEMEIEN
jgi:Ser/Thr protein kinase RdoA (MazF antagonist)